MGRFTDIAQVPEARRWAQDEMRQWCWDRNQQAMAAGWPHWLYVSQDKETGVNSIKSRNGSDARDIMKTMHGWYPDFMEWPSERLASEFRILRFMVRMGMTEDTFKTIRLAA